MFARRVRGREATQGDLARGQGGRPAEGSKGSSGPITLLGRRGPMPSNSAVPTLPPKKGLQAALKEPQPPPGPPKKKKTWPRASRTGRGQGGLGPFLQCFRPKLPT